MTTNGIGCSIFSPRQPISIRRRLNAALLAIWVAIAPSPADAANLAVQVQKGDLGAAQAQIAVMDRAMALQLRDVLAECADTLTTPNQLIAHSCDVAIARFTIEFGEDGSIQRLLYGLQDLGAINRNSLSSPIPIPLDQDLNRLSSQVIGKLSGLLSGRFSQLRGRVR